MADRPPIGADDLPEAVADSRRRKRLPFIWLLPVLVVVVAAFVTIKEKLEQGPLIGIGFQSAEGIEANKTKIRYKDVDIGDVTAVHVSKDRKRVVVTARLRRDARDYLVEDSRFWVVRPRIAAGGISGLGTLVSGAYIGIDVGKSTVEMRNFEGLEIPPIVTADLPGREFILHAEDIGSLAVGSTVYYRHIEAGQVVAYALDAGGAGVTIKAFIYQPYDGYVKLTTRFWQASGIDMSVDSDGVKLRTESLSSILEGGIAFQDIANSSAAPAAPPDSPFQLFTDRERAMRQADTEVRTFILYFKGSLRGLSVGAPVDLRGIPIGEVKSLSVEYERDEGSLRFPVQVDIFPQRIRGRSRRGDRSVGLDEASEAASRTLIDSLVAHGMRAELRTGSLLTGQKFVAMDFHTEVPPDRVGWDARPAVFPTTTGALDEIQDSVGSIAKKLDKVPFDEISGRLTAALASLDATLRSTDHLMHQVDTGIAPQVTATLRETQAAMNNAREVLGEDAPLQRDLYATLLELSRAAKSLSALVDYLERHPESILRGKPGDAP